MIAAVIVAALACSPASAPPASPYLFVWAGPNDAESMTAGAHQGSGGLSDFLSVIDANPSSATYGKVLASSEVGVPGAMAHHMELRLPVGHPLFANDFTTGQIFLLDLSTPRAPRVAARVDSVPGYRRPHSFARLPNGSVVTAMQFGNGKLAGDPGGLAEFDAAGKLIRTSSAADGAFPGAHIRPNGVELMPAIDRIVTTSMPMDDELTADVVQIWRLSDLRLLHTVAMPPSGKDSLGMFPYDARALADGRTAMLNTYYCGLFRISQIESETPRVDLVHALRGPRHDGCAVAAVVGHYWIVPSAYGRMIVSLDVTDPAHPVEISTLHTDSTFFPHWISADRGSDRIVINSTDDGESRVMIAHLDPSTGMLTWDERFREPGATVRGVRLDRHDWGHGVVGRAMAHSAVFGPAPPD